MNTWTRCSAASTPSRSGSSKSPGSISGKKSWGNEAALNEGSGKTSPSEKGEAETETLAKPALNWKVVLFNDEEHTYDYVVEMLTQVCKLSRENAFRCAVEVDMTGRTIVFYGTRPDCEAVCTKILAYGPDHRLPQSMASMNAEVEAL